MKPVLTSKKGSILSIALFAFLVIFPIFSPSPYLIHMITLIFIWSFVSTAWSYMGRFGLVSLGHGAFLGIGAYITALLFNFYSFSPWVGMLVGALGAGFLAAVVGYACFRFGIMGDYFALVTLALGVLVAPSIIALREITGGSLVLRSAIWGMHRFIFSLGVKLISTICPSCFYCSPSICGSESIKARCRRP